MLLNKFHSIALISMTLFTVGTNFALGDEPAKQPATPAVAAPAAPTVPKWSSIKESDIGKCIKGFNSNVVESEDGVHLKFAGLVDREMSKSLRIRLETPSEDEGTTEYALKFEVLGNISDVCDSKKVRTCNRDTCESVQVLDREKVQLEDIRKAREVKVCFDNKEFEAGDARAISCNSMPDNFGGALLSPKARAEADARARKKEKLDEIIELCNAAKKGDRESASALKERMEEMGIKIPNNFMERLATLADDIEMKAQEAKLGLAKSYKEMDDLLADTKSFCSTHETLKDRCKEFTLSIGSKAKDSAQNETDDGKFLSKMHLAIKAIGNAAEADPEDKRLRASLADAKLVTYNYAAATGSDQAFNAGMAKEVRSSAKAISRLAKNTNDPEIKRVSDAYDKVLSPRPVPYVYQNANGPAQALPYYYMGTGLDETFTTSQLERENARWKDELLRSNKSGGNIGPSASAPGGQLNGSSMRSGF